MIGQNFSPATFRAADRNVCQIETNRTPTGQMILRDGFNEYHAVAMDDFGDVRSVKYVLRPMQSHAERT